MSLLQQNIPDHIRQKQAEETTKRKAANFDIQPKLGRGQPQKQMGEQLMQMVIDALPGTAEEICKATGLSGGCVSQKLKICAVMTKKLPTRGAFGAGWKGYYERKSS